MDGSAASRVPVQGAWAPPLPEAAGFEHSVVSTPGLRTHVATIGAGEPVVMLHGFPQHWWEWREVAPRIAEAGFRVICPDLRGSGWTDAAEPGFTRKAMLGDVVALLDELGISSAHIISHDLGAVVAGQLAYLHPERVRSSVQFAVPPGFMAFSTRLLPAFAHMPRLLMHRAGSGLQWLFGDHYAAKPFTAETIDAYLRVQRRPGAGDSVRALYRGMIIPESMRLASGHYRRQHLTPPTLAVFGRLDGPFTEDTVRAICRGSERFADRFELAFIEGAAHFVVDDAPDAVADIALNWIRQS
ncbi:pimeloyl-ACP methyl ester carboxylesterase [Microbacterium sp. W4I4]|uniref:alpha/beta fold hydrolase n=1 Tax=Microbacterium sp. W4I4 TaxID=3042295 RepID=UPI0027873612|nr:alpha/beta hydrolase [Microbacterium sp. W4I4]MDQ0615745.1 pimeloyl-ACP methyl ester carboxylesterase [Microbacterium sp. W4I4]